MGAYIIRRILISIPVLFGITLIGFVALKLAPGDPLLSSVNPETLANLLSHPEILAAERHRLGFDQPIFPNQYLTWLGGVLQGDFGYSVTSHRSIADEIGARVPQTLLLMVTALTMAICIGIPIGVITAVRQYSKLDYVLNSAAIFLASTPVFVLGLVAIYIFAVNLHVLPTGQVAHGRTDRSDRHVLPPDPAGDGAGHRQRRAARALHAGEHARRPQQRVRHDGPSRRASSYRLVIMRHAFRNGLIPIITIVALLIPEAVAGAVITEQVFAWNGMGSAGRQGGQRPRPVADDGHHPDHRDRRPRRQHHRRHRLRRRRSTGGI